MCLLDGASPFALKGPPLSWLHSNRAALNLGVPYAGQATDAKHDPIAHSGAPTGRSPEPWFQGGLGERLLERALAAGLAGDR